MSNRSWGIVNMTFFSAGWWALGSTVLSGVEVWIVGAIGLLVVVALFTSAWRLRADDDGARVGEDWRFGAIVAAEFAAIFVVAVAAGRAGRVDWIPALICAVVGAHFLPLARLFATPVYVATGIALVVLAALTFLTIPTLDLSNSTWRWLPGFGAAIVLWATSVWLATPRTRRHRSLARFPRTAF